MYKAMVVGWVVGWRWPAGRPKPPLPLGWRSSYTQNGTQNVKYVAVQHSTVDGRVHDC